VLGELSRVAPKKEGGKGIGLFSLPCRRPGRRNHLTTCRGPKDGAIPPHRRADAGVGAGDSTRACRAELARPSGASIGCAHEGVGAICHGCASIDVKAKNTPNPARVPARLGYPSDATVGCVQDGARAPHIRSHRRAGVDVGAGDATERAYRPAGLNCPCRPTIAGPHDRAETAIISHCRAGVGVGAGNC
jgi:hypothetical protein